MSHYKQGANNAATFGGHILRDERLPNGGPNYRGTNDDGYHTNDGQWPYISDVYREYLHDGTRYQNQPMKTQQNLIHQMFYSDANVRHIQRSIRAAGFNAAPSLSVLSGFMDEVYTNDAPFGAHNRIDPTRSMSQVHANDGGLGYSKYYLHRLNTQLLNRVLRNMSVMRQSRMQYLRDISGFQGPLELNRPIFASSKYAGDNLRMDFRLPPPPDGRDPQAYRTT